MTITELAVDAERVVLGAMMIDPTVVDRITRTLSAASFTDPRHGAVFTAILGAHADGEPVEPVSIGTRLERSGDLGRIGGIVTLFNLIETVPTAANAGYYANLVRDAALGRDLAAIGVRAKQYAAELPPSVAAERVRADLDALVLPASADDPRKIMDVASEAFDVMEAAAVAATTGSDAVLPTGLAELDAVLGGGLRAGQIAVVAGRTSMGKSVLARKLARTAAFDHKVPTLMVSLEMTAVEIFLAVMSAELSIPLNEIKRGWLSEDNWVRIARWSGEHADTPLFIDDTAGMTIADIRAKATRMQRTTGLGLIVVDYLQLLDTGRQKESRQVAVADMSRALKVLAQALNIPVVVVAQLNRGPEMRSDKKPQLSDLRESGAIENDADVVILIHREDYYDQSTPRVGEADLIVAKNRSGPKDTVVVASRLHMSDFASMGIA